MIRTKEKAFIPETSSPSPSLWLCLGEWIPLKMWLRWARCFSERPKLPSVDFTCEPFGLCVTSVPQSERNSRPSTIVGMVSRNGYYWRGLLLPCYSVWVAVDRCCGLECTLSVPLWVIRSLFVALYYSRQREKWFVLALLTSGIYMHPPLRWDW